MGKILMGSKLSSKEEGNLNFHEDNRFLEHCKDYEKFLSGSIFLKCTRVVYIS